MQQQEGNYREKASWKPNRDVDMLRKWKGRVLHSPTPAFIKHCQTLERVTGEDWLPPLGTWGFRRLVPWTLWHSSTQAGTCSPLCLSLRGLTGATRLRDYTHKNSDSGSEPLPGLCHEWLVPRTASKTLWPCSLLGQKAASENRGRVHGPVLPRRNVTTSFCSLERALGVFPGVSDSSHCWQEKRPRKFGRGQPSWRGGCPEMPDAPLPGLPAARPRAPAAARRGLQGPRSVPHVVMGNHQPMAWSC